jgi:tRNA modification GTPase
MNAETDTIVAIATPPGRGGVGVIRVSGQKVNLIVDKLIGKTLSPRKAHFTPFMNTDKTVIDEGLALVFPEPHSFTGEDVLELQGHGGQVILDMLLKAIIDCGARLARPGEFSERAFLNDKLDLAQAEAIADLIDASSTEAARSAVRSLQGEFSNAIHELVDGLIELRLYVEAAIDFPEEEIDFLSDGKVLNQLSELRAHLDKVMDKAKQGTILRDGMTVVIAGLPNAGKSSLLNALSGDDRAIVTDIPGTTRDVIKESIHIDGMPLHIIDTAGLRETDDAVEQMGINRAKAAIKNADEVLYITDSTQTELMDESLSALKHLVDKKSITIIQNKIDLSKTTPRIDSGDHTTCIYLSAKAQLGLDLLKQHLKDKMGYLSHGEGVFIARRRHLTALNLADQHVNRALSQLTEQQAGELVAEELRLAQVALDEITGKFTTDDLLGKIFSSFCIGK